MNVPNKEKAWEEAGKLFGTDYEKDERASKNAGYPIYRHPTLNPNSKICDLGVRLEVTTGEYGETTTNIWIEKAPKQERGCRTYTNYSKHSGVDQFALQRLAADILKYGKKISEARHTAFAHFPDGKTMVIPTGSHCIEAINEITGDRYWVHFNGCRVTEIIEEHTTAAQ
ncbi:MAG: hypothetical protein R3Y62_08580 [Eubacteriales bacterium]